MRWRKTWVFAGCALLVLAALAHAEEQPPVAVVSSLNATLLDVLKQAETLGYQGRYDRLAPVVRDTLDLDFMAEKSLGRHWNTLGDADRKRWMQLFGEFTTANYAANFDKYSGQTFELLGEERDTSETTLVRTRVVDPAGENVELTYRLREADGRWRIVDVYLKGTVSELALRRSDYSSVLERDGFEVLVSTLRSKIADLAAGRGKRQGV